MEHAWYLFPGQTLETTKIKDRGKALIASPVAWKKITSHLDRKKIQQQQLEEELEHRRYLKDGSNNMTKDWDNSIEKIRQRRFEEHDRRVREREENLIKRFMQLTGEQAEEREQIVIEARKRLYMVQQHSRTVNSALLLTEVLHERGLQLEFDAGVREEERKEEELYAKEVKYNAEQEKIENAEKKRKRIETDVKHSLELKQQVKELQEAEKKEREENIKKEIEDNKQAIQEMKAIRDYEILLDKKKKANVTQLFHDFHDEQARVKEQARIQDETENKIVQIVSRGKCRIENMKKKKDKQMADEKRQLQERMAAKIVVEMEKKAEEDAELAAANAKEYEEKQLEMLRKKAAYYARLRRQLQEDRIEVLERRKKEAERDREIQKWDMINRFKNDEVFKQYNQDYAQKVYDEKIKYKKQLQKQMKDDDTTEYDKMCTEADLQYEKDKLANADKAFFAYAEEVMDLARSRGRTTEHLEKVVHKYKVENGLLPMKKNLSMLKSNVPINHRKNKKHDFMPTYA